MSDFFDEIIKEDDEILFVGTWNLGKMSRLMTRKSAHIFLKDYEDHMRRLDVVFFQELSSTALEALCETFQDDFKFIKTKRKRTKKNEYLLVMIQKNLSIKVNYLNVHMPRHPKKSDFEELFMENEVNSEDAFIIAGDFNRDLHKQKYQDRYLKRMPNNIRIDSSEHLTTMKNSIDFIMYNSYFLREAEVTVFPFTPIGDEGNHYLKVMQFEILDNIVTEKTRARADSDSGTDENTDYSSHDDEESQEDEEEDDQEDHLSEILSNLKLNQGRKK